MRKLLLILVPLAVASLVTLRVSGGTPAIRIPDAAQMDGDGRPIVLPITFQANGAAVCGFSQKLLFDWNKLEFLGLIIGPAAQAANKILLFNQNPTTKVVTMGITHPQGQFCQISDGILAYLTVLLKPRTPNGPIAMDFAPMNTPGVDAYDCAGGYDSIPIDFIGGTFTVEGPYCAGEFNPTVPTGAPVGTPVQFRANFTSFDCVGHPEYHWDFGDVNYGGGDSTEADPSWTYDNIGTFYWKLSVRLYLSVWEETGIIRIGPLFDCDGNGQVSIGEVQKAINMFLETLAPDCGMDCSGDGSVSIGEVQKVINVFLGIPSPC